MNSFFGKPEGDIFIDDKAFNSEAWGWKCSNKSNNPVKENDIDEIDNLLKLQLEAIKKSLIDHQLKRELLKFLKR